MSKKQKSVSVNGEFYNLLVLEASRRKLTVAKFVETVVNRALDTK